MHRTFKSSNVLDSTTAAPPGANYIMVAIIFLFFGAAILVVAFISGYMIPLDFSFLFWIGGFCFVIALVSFVGAFIAGDKNKGTETDSSVIASQAETEKSVSEEPLKKGKWTPQQFQKWKMKYYGRADRFASLPGSDFKELVSELFRRMDYSVEHSAYHADFGIDLIARKGKEVISIEVKKWKQGRDVGTEIVRRAVEGRWKCGASKAIIITTSSFTPKARVLARKNPIELWNFQKLDILIERYIVKGETKT